MKRRQLTAEERALWRQAMRDTRPLPGRDENPSSEEAKTEKKTSVPARRKKAPAPEPAAASSRPCSAPRPAPPPGGLDAAARRRLRRGRMEIEGRVDLHGMRQSQAHQRLTRFIAESQAAGRRCVLVITGKGGRPSATGEAGFMQRGEEGVLRRQVPLWLGQEPNASRVFAVEQAHPRHGGAGAFYVFLRKPRHGGGHS